MVITGGGSGIGRATAHAFADAGEAVLIVGRSAEALAETARGRDHIHVLPLDITTPGAAAAVVETALRELGRIDVLVNNAGIARYADLPSLEREAVEAQIATNLVAPVFLTQRALDALTDTKGVVVNLSSSGSVGLRTMPGNAVYCATKVALDALTRNWSVELASRGIRVVAVAPGVVDTGVALRAGMPEAEYDAFLKRISAQIPSGRVGTPEDIAWWIVTVTAAPSGYLNGALLPVDGALSLT
ncbi:SDR family oxidoreductase [Actinomadura sp. LCR2-06]|uniref:SDR family oxidoreductase n=1 Tax=Actinomadura violacea TaxID=2819934 RepID=A0ABS3S0W8_9ACTN|nr:SDR family oxidoreductase [Actinomadura violacea]